MEWLSIDDLCSCSRTCKRLQELCENHFRRKYPNEATKELKIGFKLKSDRKLHISPFHSYVKCFHNFNQNVKIYVWIVDKEKLRDKRLECSLVENFVKTKCDENLKKICISNDFKLVPFCKEIENFLRNVEVVRFIDRSEKGQDEATFLKYCPNVTKLILSSYLHVENVDAILQQKYHQLTHFGFLGGFVESLNADKLESFFQMNERIQCVELKFRFYLNRCHIRDVLKCIHTLDYVSNLEHLHLSIDEPLTKGFGDICCYLNVLCNRDNFKSLEIELFGEEGADALKLHAKQLANVKKLTKLHLTFM